MKGMDLELESLEFTKLEILPWGFDD